MRPSRLIDYTIEIKIYCGKKLYKLFLCKVYLYCIKYSYSKGHILRINALFPIIIITFCYYINI